VSFVSGLNLSAWERADWRPGYPGSLPFEIVHALGVPSSEMAHWAVARAGWVFTLTPSSTREDRIGVGCT
jgi:hypothetical protein